jgi:hypothetical protein
VFNDHEAIDEHPADHPFAPDVLLVPFGTVNAWSSPVDVRKYYCIFEEEAS